MKWTDDEAISWLQSNHARRVLIHVVDSIGDGREILSANTFMALGLPWPLVARSEAVHMSDDEQLGGRITAADGSSPETLRGVCTLDLLTDIVGLLALPWKVAIGRATAARNRAAAIRDFCEGKKAETAKP
jgi:hypothetical protein